MSNNAIPSYRRKRNSNGKYYAFVAINGKRKSGYSKLEPEPISDIMTQLLHENSTD